MASQLTVLALNTFLADRLVILASTQAETKIGLLDPKTSPRIQGREQTQVPGRKHLHGVANKYGLALFSFQFKLDEI